MRSFTTVRAASRRAAMLVTLPLMYGCAHSLLYDENRDKQGQEAKKAVAEIRLQDIVRSLETTFIDLAAREEANATDEAAHAFDRELVLQTRARTLRSTYSDAREMVDEDGLITVLEARLRDELGMRATVEQLVRVPGQEGATAERLGSLTTDEQRALFQVQVEDLKIAAANVTAGANESELGLINFWGVLGHRFRNCGEVYATAAVPIDTATTRKRSAFLPAEPAVGPAGPAEQPDETRSVHEGAPAAAKAIAIEASDKSALPSDRFLARFALARQTAAKAEFAQLVSYCNSLDAAAENVLGSYGGGLVAEVSRKIENLETEIRNYELARRARLDELDKAEGELKSLEDAVKHGKSTLEAVAGRAAELQKIISKIGEAATKDPNFPGADLLAGEKLERLEAVLGAVAGSSSDDSVELNADDQAAVALVRGLPELADEVDRLLKDATRPRLVPFVAAVEHQKLVVRAIEAAKDAKSKQADALRRSREAALNEGSAIADVLWDLSEDPFWGDQSIMDLEQDLPRDKKGIFHRALATYAHDVQRFRIEQAVWNARADAARYEESLMQSKFAAAQWDNLIDTIAAVLADYHAAGIKKSELDEFFKALGLVTIGIGAAQ